MQKPITSKPIFILGSGRSGTSILTAALKSGADIPGFNEGHFLPLMTYFIRETERYFRMKEKLRSNQKHMIAHMDQTAIEKEIVALFKNRCEMIHQEKVWLDKSPTADMLMAVPYLKQAWPESRYIFAKRRGIENIISRLKKFPHVDFENHCKLWSECMQAWLTVKSQVYDCSIEVDQRDIALHPKKTAARIGQFLRLDAKQVDKIQGIFANKRPQSTGGQEHEKALGITETGWTAAQIKTFRKHCGKVSEIFGYSETSDYFL